MVWDVVVWWCGVKADERMQCVLTLLCQEYSLTLFHKLFFLHGSMPPFLSRSKTTATPPPSTLISHKTHIFPQYFADNTCPHIPQNVLLNHKQLNHLSHHRHNQYADAF